MKRVVIAGGSGQIGRALTDVLVKSGYQVVILSRNPSSAARTPQGVGVERWDGRSALGWGQWVDGATAVVNLAGENIGIPPIPWWLPGRRQRIHDSRVNAGRAMVEAVKAAAEKPKVLIQASGINYYGLRSDKAITEDEPPGNDFAAAVCVDWEASTAEVESLGVRRAIIRTAPNLTPKGGILFWLALPFRLFVGGPLGSGRQWFSWIHVDDQVSAIRFLIENDSTGGAYNLSAPNPVTNAELGRALGHAINRPYWFPTPGFGIRLAFGELGDSMILGSQRVLPERLRQAGYEFKFPELAGALKSLVG